MNPRRHTLTTSPKVEYACSIERPHDSADLIVLIACGACAVALICFALMGWLA